MRVAIVGQGRVGRSLAILLPRVGVSVVAIARGERIVDADVFWLTVSDSAIAEVATNLPRSGIALHAAGGLGAKILGDRDERGVCHPLMTFPGPEIRVPDLRGCAARVEGTPRALAAARQLAKVLGMRPIEISPGQIARYHAAAALASGHNAAVFALAVRTLTEAGVNKADAASMLLPLTMASLERVAEAGPAALTGPAARGDTETTARHEALLSRQDAAVYREISRMIARLRDDR